MIILKKITNFANCYQFNYQFNVIEKCNFAGFEMIDIAR